MAQGDVLIIGQVTYEEHVAKVDTDIVKGQLYCDDGSGGGLVPATKALAAVNKVVMPTHDHDYSESTNHKILCIRSGPVEAAKLAGESTAIKKGQKVTISATAGKSGKFTKGDIPEGGAETYFTAAVESGIQAAIDQNLADIGDAYADSTDADTTQKLWLK